MADENEAGESEDSEFEEVEDREQMGRDYDALKEALMKRCEAADITVAERTFDPDEPSARYLTLRMPNGRFTRGRSLMATNEIECFLSTPFEKFVFIADYQAIVSYEDGTIEALLRGVVSPNVLYRRLIAPRKRSRNGIEQERWIELKSPLGSTISLSIGKPTKNTFVISSRETKIPTVKLSGLTISTHKQAVDILEKVCNAFFFEIDLTSGIALSIARIRRRFAPPRNWNVQPPEPEFPKYEYDAAPMSLYWYARSAIGMPLLQYLAFYQVIEFYFPTYSQKEAGRRILSVLKDPAFRPDREADIGRLLSTIGGSRRGSFGSEREQLRATLQECADTGSLFRFLTEDEERKEFFSKKQPGLTERKLSLYAPHANLRSETADLIYDIRCKIVHTKGEANEEDGRVDLLLPYSEEADLLHEDIPLIEYIARRVLITASSPLNLQA